MATILSRLEIVRLLHRITKPKNQLLIALAYGTGLRLCEIINLKARDVDFEKSAIHCARRLIVIPNRLKNPLWKLLSNKKGNDFAFKITPRGLQKMFERAVKKANIPKGATFLSLRHSFAAHLAEEGVNFRIIQKLMGYSRTRAPRACAKATASVSQKIRSPLEQSGFLIASA